MSIVQRINDIVRAASPDQPRCPTPLRPSAGLVSRIPAAPVTSHFSDTIPFASTGPTSRPGTQQQSRSKNLTQSAQLQTFAPSATLQSIVSQGGTHYGVHEGCSEDVYSFHEKRLVSEINLMRCDPMGYAKLVEREATVARPFVPTEMTLSVLTKFAADLDSQKQRASEQLDDMASQKKKEISDLHTQWVAEDMDRAKKAKKAVASKKGATPEPEMDSDRTELLHQLDKKYAVLQKDLAKEYEVSSVALQSANQGLKVLRDCISKLQSLPTGGLPSLLYNRGLSLASRQVCCGKPASSVSTRELRDICAQYGELGDKISVAQHCGVTSTRQTVMEILMGLQDAKKSGRNALLDPSFHAVGCGWRKRSKTESVSTFIVSSAFEELDAIFSRPHMSLEDIRRLLPLATKHVNATTIVKLHATHLNVELVSPVSHPVVCGNDAAVQLRCGEGVQVVACLGADSDPTPQTPLAGCGDVFVQHTLDEGIVEVKVVLPARGNFKVFLFGRHKDDGAAVGFHCIGVVRLAASQWHSAHIVAPMPIVTAEFSDRQCTLLSPLVGSLKCDQLATFEILIPLTPSYLQSDLQRIAKTVAETRQRIGTSQGSRPPTSAQHVPQAAERCGGSAASHASEGGKSSSAPAASASSIDAGATCDELQSSLESARNTLLTVRSTRDAEVPVLQTEIAAQHRELAKKKGKELEKAKLSIAELEDQIKSLDEAVVAVEQRIATLEDKIVNQRRAEKRAAAQLQRFLREERKYIEAADRNAPLHVQLSLDERRASFTPVDHEYTLYKLTTRLPKDPGPVTIFVNGIATVMFEAAE